MADAKRDVNRIVMGMGISTDDLTTLIPITMDASTGRILIDAVEVATSSPAIAAIKRDANTVTIVSGVTDDSDLTQEAMRFETVNNYTLVDIIAG